MAVPAVALRTDLRELLAIYRDQLADPLLARIGAELLAESRRDGVLGEMLLRVLLMQSRGDDDYLDTLTAATEAALKAAIPTR